MKLSEVFILSGIEKKEADAIESVSNIKRFSTESEL